MTTPSSGSPEYGEDYVAARISIEVNDAGPGIREITQEVDRLRTALEAATRASGDMTQYLERMEGAAKRATEEQSRLTAVAREMTAVGTRATDMSVPLGASQGPPRPWEAGMGGGTGDTGSGRITHPREWLNMQAARGRIRGDDAESIQRGDLGEVADRIAEREKAVDEEEAKGGSATSMVKRMARGTTLAQQVAREMGPNGSPTGLEQLSKRALDWAHGRLSAQAAGRVPHGAAMDHEGIAGPGTGSDPAEYGPEAETESSLSGAGRGLGGAIMGAATKLPGIGGFIMALGALKMAVSGVAQEIQGARNIGSLRGGAAGEGFKVEAKTKALSLINPFLTQDQARQIYQSVMSEGYGDASGGGADNVIDFVSHNIERMNISVADSMKMLRDTIVGQGEGDKQGVSHAVDTLNKQLDQTRTLTKDTVMSQPEFRQGVMSMRQRLIESGASPEEAGRTAETAELVGGKDQVTKGQFGAVASSFATEQNSMWLRAFGGPGGTPLQGARGLFPQVTAAYLEQQGGNAYNDATMNVLKSDARIASMPGDAELNQGYRFQQRLRQQTGNDDAIGANTNLNQAIRMMKDVQSGKEDEDMKRAQAEMARSGGGPHSPGGGREEVSGNVTIDLTSRAAQMLQVKGGKNVHLTSTQKGANRGASDMAVNNDPNY